MYEIDACYKIVFEAMLDEDVLGTLARGICEYTGAKTAFFSETGVLLADFGFESVEVSFKLKKHLTTEDYELLCTGQEREGHYTCFVPVSVEKQIRGYVLVVHEKRGDVSFFQKLGELLAHEVRAFYTEIQEPCVYLQSLREHIAAWTIFEDENGIGKLQDGFGGKYIVGLFPKQDGEGRITAAVLGSLYSFLCIYEKQGYFFVLFYGLTQEKAENLYTKIEKGQVEGCISEIFSNLLLCKTKKELLSRMNHIHAVDRNQKIKREKEWSLQGMYSIASPLIEEAGLSDYTVLSLAEEDERNNTELYYTLKMYLLCENSVTVTAKRMHIHRNTLVYRLKQIQECINLKLDEKTSRELLAFMMMYDITRQYKE